MKIISRKTPKIYHETGLSSFLEIPPHDPEGMKKAEDQLAGRKYWRKEISDLLLTYNQSIGNDAVAFQKIQELQNDNTYCVFTGQQLGFMSGPAYTILKGIACLLLAREANAVPIFWLATEDHDVGEIDHTYLLDTLGNLSKFHLSLPKDGRFVEELFLTTKHFKVINEFLEAVELPDLIKDLSGETSYTKMMVHIMVRLFSGTGLVFVEPYILRNLASSFFQKEISECDEIMKVLQNTTQKFVEAGGKGALDVSEGTNLFLKMEGKFRCKIHRDGDGFHVGREKFSKEELLIIVESEPERFSTNAAARPLLQSTLFPTLAYVAGPTELTYYHQ
ncbi:MAG: putative cysteine ligase BshC, partial [Chlamydiae bacterium]|nr:putative cysteine ligase BshC [Chlamydiota bacterium]